MKLKTQRYFNLRGLECSNVIEQDLLRKRIKNRSRRDLDTRQLNKLLEILIWVCNDQSFPKQQI